MELIETLIVCFSPFVVLYRDQSTLNSCYMIYHSYIPQYLIDNVSLSHIPYILLFQSSLAVRDELWIFLIVKKKMTQVKQLVINGFTFLMDNFDYVST